MDSGESLSSMESTTGTRRSCRRRPLQTCGASVLAISHIAYVKVEGVDGPIGSVTKKMAALATPACPFVYAVQCHWLALLSFMDDCILAIEDKLEKLLPGSAHALDKLDELLRVAETLPGRFDDAIDKLPSVIHRVPVLEFVFANVVYWLNFCLSQLAVTDWKSSDVARQKDILVDKTCDKPNNKKELSWADKVHQSEPGAEIMDMPKSPAEVERELLLNRSYKEALEKGTKEEKETKEDDNICEETGKSTVLTKQVEGRREKNEKEKKGKEERMEGLAVDQKAINENIVREEEGAGMISNGDPILALFNSGWCMTAGGAGSPLESQSKLEEG